MSTTGNRGITSGLKALVGKYGDNAVKGVSRNVLGTFLAIYTYLYGKDEHQLTEAQILISIRLAKVRIRVRTSGEVTFSEVSTVTTGHVAAGIWECDHCPPRSGQKNKKAQLYSSTRLANRRRLRLASTYPSTSVRDAHASGDDGEASKTTDPIVIKNQKGTTIYQIQNLNIYLTAEVVQQLNLNPSQVINMVQEQLEKEIKKV